MDHISVNGVDSQYNTLSNPRAYCIDFNVNVYSVSFLLCSSKSRVILLCQCVDYTICPFLPPLLIHIRNTAGIVCIRINVRVLDLLVFNFTCRLTFATANPFFVLLRFIYVRICYFFHVSVAFYFSSHFMQRQRKRERKKKRICTRLRIEHTMMKQSRFDGVAWNKVIVHFHRFGWLLLRHRFYCVLARSAASFVALFFFLAARFLFVYTLAKIICAQAEISR